MVQAKLGLITTGSGPRPEYVNYHRNLLAYLGVDVEIEIRHALAGLTRSEIQAIEARPGDDYIGCHVVEEGGTGDRMGVGFGHVWIGSQHLVPIYQRLVDDLEETGVDATILCCAEEYGRHALHSSRPLVMPWRVMTEWVRISTETIPRPIVGILIPDEEHRRQDTRTWRSQQWMRDLTVVIESRSRGMDAALGSFRKQKVGFVINWGYGYAIAPGDPADSIEAIEEAVQAPFLTPHRFSTLHVRNLLRPAIRDRTFAAGPKA